MVHPYSLSPHYSHAIQSFGNRGRATRSRKGHRNIPAIWPICRKTTSLALRVLDLRCPASQLAANNRRRKDIFTLPRADQQLLTELGYKEKLAEVDKAISVNATFLKQIVSNTEIFEPESIGDSGGYSEPESVDVQLGQGPSRPHSHSHGSTCIPL